MKNSTNTIITVILAVAVVALFVLHFADKPKTPKMAPMPIGDSTVVMPIAYVTIDSLMTQYNYAKDVNDKLMASAETKQANLNAQGRQLEKEMQDFQYKMNNNAFFSQERAEREYQRLAKKQQDFQQLQQKLSGELMEEQAKTMKSLSDTIWSQIRTYNELHGHYQMILTNQGGSIIYSVPMYDITEEVVKYLNDQYDPSKSTAEKEDTDKK
ncbi:OmpH family outer membrane protein [uncultured Porphyromonas sp.]|uniref:OmpH family outer membrane protein n=1 Tax=uncultured Porphyromonas sp. TaxID=159274 RepID=UPI0025EE492F|nr:OmpH family outer membrane protein [uncultured Porphyromonas sp.]